MRGATVADQHLPSSGHEQTTSDFDVLYADLSLKVSPRKAPNPLRSANPERLKSARAAIRRIVAARRAGFAPPER
jgi:hypothetical protein